MMQSSTLAMELSFEIQETESGRLMAFCVENRGLIVSGDTLEEITAEIPKAYQALLDAGIAPNGQPKPPREPLVPRVRQITVAA